MSLYRAIIKRLFLVSVSAFFISSCATGEQEKQLEQTQVQPLQSKITHTQHYNAKQLLNDGFARSRSNYLLAQRQQINTSLTAINYPLTNYIKFEQLQLLPYLREKDISLFLMSEKNTYIEKKIRSRWLKQLSEAGEWSRYEQFYNPNIASTAEHCDYFNSLHYQNRTTEALTVIPRFWMSSSALPYNCSTALDIWGNSASIDQNLVWKRLHKVLALGKTTLASQILRFFSESQYNIASAYLETYKYPSLLSTYSKTFNNHHQRDEIYTNLIAKIASQSPYQASKLINQNKQLSFNKTQQKLINKQFRNKVSKDLRPMLLNQNWSSVVSLLNSLPSSEQQKPKWIYWLARAHEQLRNTKTAKEYYLKASQERDYYGYLAADKIKKPYQLAHKDSPVSSKQLNRIAQRAGIQRAIEFFRLGNLKQARREWAFSIRDFNRFELAAAAKVAQLCGWHQQAIFTIAKAGFWNDTVLRFPLAHEEIIRKHANIQGIDSNWVYGIIRQESAFGYDANSHAGARGLMQLMPATAKQTARKVGLPYEKHRLNEEAYNISLGAAYLGQMSSRFNNNRILASAAYNAGPSRASRWLKETHKRTAADIWIENIPYKETRKYVKSVLFYNVVYGLIRGETVKLLEPHEVSLAHEPTLFFKPYE